MPFSRTRIDDIHSIYCHHDYRLSSDTDDARMVRVGLSVYENRGSDWEVETQEVMTTKQQLTERFGQERADQVHDLITHVNTSLNQAFAQQASDITRAFPALDRDDVLVCIFKTMFDFGLAGYCQLKNVEDSYDEIHEAMLRAFRYQVEKVK